jgi:hypothetical protein
MTTLGTVGTTYADDNSTLGVTTTIVSTSRDNDFRRPFFDDDLFFRPRFFFNPFFDFEDDDAFFEDDDDLRFGFGFDRERDDD